MSIQSTLLKVLAGIGFLMNAYLNLYKYRLDRSKTVRHWRTTFAEYRGTAELLRVLAHFIPFGLSLDLLYLCGDDPAVYRTVREIISDTEPGRTEVGQNTAKEILLHLKEMVDDQRMRASSGPSASGRNTPSSSASSLYFSARCSIS